MGFQPMFHRQDADVTSRGEVNACRASKFGGSRRYHPALAERQS